jgi:hypothetical protein
MIPVDVLLLLLSHLLPVRMFHQPEHLTLLLFILFV